jgi:hypothetical protein
MTAEELIGLLTLDGLVQELAECRGRVEQEGPA